MASLPRPRPSAPCVAVQGGRPDCIANRAFIQGRARYRIADLSSVTLVAVA